jgi:hypothetical protein
MVGIDLYMIGNKDSFKALEERIQELKNNDRILLIGPSGIGKTYSIEYLCKKYDWECIILDSLECSSSKELMDRLMKLHRWKDMGQFQETYKKRLLLVDELETLIKMDRNIPSTLIKFWNQQENSMPCIVVGQYEADKKIGELKKRCQYHFYWNALTPNDLFLHFKTTLPKKTIDLKILKEICHSVNGSFYAATHAIQQQSSLDSQDTFHRIEDVFKKTSVLDIKTILLEDPWIHPLKIIENANKIYHIPVYVSFLKDFLFFEQWIYQCSLEDSSMMLDYLSEIIFKYNQTIYKKHIKPSTPMEFTKLLSSISTQKKIHRSIYDKTNPSIPISEIGCYWASQLKTNK